MRKLIIGAVLALLAGCGEVGEGEREGSHGVEAPGGFAEAVADSGGPVMDSTSLGAHGGAIGGATTATGTTGGTGPAATGTATTADTTRR